MIREIRKAILNIVVKQLFNIVSKYIGIRISDEIEEALSNISKNTKKTKSFHIKKAIEQYLEDLEDYLEGMHILSLNNKTYSLEEVKAKLSLE